jgi:hypothetical protein
VPKALRVIDLGVLVAQGTCGLAACVILRFPPSMTAPLEVALYLFGFGLLVISMGAWALIYRRSRPKPSLAVTPVHLLANQPNDLDSSATTDDRLLN